MTNTTVHTEIFQATLDRHAKALAEATASFTEKVESHGLLCTLEWAKEEALTVAQAELWATVQGIYTREGVPAAGNPVAAIEAVLQHVTNQLLNNWVHQSSTSQFHNATAAAKAEGYARFQAEAAGLIEFLTTPENVFVKASV